MRASSLLCFLLIACAPTETTEAVASHRSALVTAHAGLPASQLGVSVTVCPGAIYLGGAPGDGTVISPNPSTTGLPLRSTAPGGVGHSVLCAKSNAGTLQLFAGGDGGAYQLLRDGGATLVRAVEHDGDPVPVVALDYDGEKLLMGAPPSAWLGPDRELSSPGSSEEFGAAVLFAGSYALVGDPALGTVSVYDSDGSLLYVIDPALPNSRFGAALAWGVVQQGHGPELLVGAPGEQRVHLFSLGINTATPTGFVPATGLALPGGFGGSLALEPLNLRDAGVLNAVWVGAPGGDELDEFVNGQLVHTEPSPEPGILFGASLDAAPGRVVIGAPKAATGNGAMYFLETPFSRPAEPRVCSGSAPCSLHCRVGSCVAGVLCVEDACSNGNCGCGVGFECDENRQLCVELPDAGVPDAGEADAGEADAGLTPDAGATDAGVKPDAGTPDAGTTAVEPVQFTTCGCTSGPALTFLWLGALLWRRRSAHS